MMSAPIIEPFKCKEYDCKQSKYEQCGKLPTRSLILAPSGGGKTILIQNLILNVYKGCFERIYVFSPSIDIDSAWQPVKDYIAKELKINNEKEKIYFDSYEPDELNNIIETQHKIIELLKKNKQKKLYQILIIIDDFADDQAFTRQSKLLHSLYIRGRHMMISTITATQVYKAISPIIRKNITDLYVFKLRNQQDLDSVIEEVSAVSNKKTLFELYNTATSTPYSFLYIKLNSKSIDDMFYVNFETLLKIK